jgi:chromosome segregation ATPase
VISLDQIRQLDIRVKKAVTAVKSLSAENAALKQQINHLEARLDELSREASSRKADEEQLEVSLQNVLDVLDEVDSETAGMEPEPPADSNIIEAVSDPENSEADTVGDPAESLEEKEPEETPVPDQKEVAFDEEQPGISVAEDVDSDLQMPEQESPVYTDDAESAEKLPVSEESDEPEQTVPDTAEKDDDPEIINLDSSENGEQFQSEFDIF